MRWLTCAFVVVVGLGIFNEARMRAQLAVPVVAAANHRSIAARTAAEVSEATSLLTRMVGAGELKSADVRDDADVAGRRFETYRQFHRGVPVEGGSVTVQKAGDATISAFGTLYTDIGIDVVPAISSDEAERVVRQASQRDLVANTRPALMIMPTATGAFVLVYQATATNAMTYAVDANTGVIVRTTRESRDAVGTGTGVHGDLKKISTAGEGNSFRTQDDLRPGGIATLDTGGSEAALNRILNGGSVATDYATDGDNVWTDSRVVDAHVHSGWAYDYFFKRFQWSGSNGSGSRSTSIVHRGLANNAVFFSPPFGPGGFGAAVFGDTTAGVPITSLDIVGHELMHGITNSSVRARTGSGLRDALFLEGVGTRSFTFNGNVFDCDTTVLIYSDGQRFPFLCEGGRYVLVANHGGAIHESFSDVLGTGVEFFHQSPGDGPLRSDYLIAEDVTGLGPFRSLSNPAAISVRHDTGTVPYPDHRNAMMRFAVVLLQGTQANPILIDIAPLAFVNGAPVTLFTRGDDDAGVHWNATVLGHAFYLAVEGGRNATSGITVAGAGAANRAQVERAFFRAMTQLMPSGPSLSTAALAVFQSAVDLYGISSPITQAIGQAFVAVGLLVAA